MRELPRAWNGVPVGYYTDWTCFYYDPASGEAEWDHDWKHIRDWYGDPGVINGTCDIYYKECQRCGTEEDWEPTAGDFYDDYDY